MHQGKKRQAKRRSCERLILSQLALPVLGSFIRVDLEENFGTNISLAALFLSHREQAT